MSRGYQGKYKHLETQRPPDEENHCKKKAAVTYTEAMKIIDRAEKDEGKKLSWYKCEYCEKIHLTSRS